MDNFLGQFGPATVGGLAIGSIYALVALGYTMVYGVLRLINFAHSEVFTIGGFAAVGVFLMVGVSAPVGGFALIGLLLLTVLVAMAASGGTALLLEQVAYRPLRKHGSSRLAALISAIGASLFLQELIKLVIIPHVFGQSNGAIQLQNMPRVIDKTPLFSIGNAPIRLDHVIIVVAAVIMMVLLDRLVNGTRVGRGIRATAQDPEAAVLMGVNIDKVVRTTFLLGGAMAGVAGVLYLLYFENLDYRVGFVVGIKAFTAAVLGGIGNLRGALLGGFVLGLVESWSSIFLGAEWSEVTAFVVLVLVLMFRPTGILGESLQRARA
ncbi:amino acid/amide ABC transporter membrane protein 1 (HAAT family) [Herbihabitans rhizosphaerae]|uniref:Amino acid/amide ABC transporter membrane protein 1 (HAAT family) n=1 Tax=Herbihabitans rhizosphaerae TaxID=1872711 RepID=A0A4Q7KIZ1_9PSEU|nr:branched-chain amino acid ABC transporter permease [Herbihabitans rhizosphaerae]RZS34910.1 amino acid/amide ABC transporter membrane protein 1 (HAAT family) [Herbihabitans rhizosphaerae]